MPATSLLVPDRETGTPTNQPVTRPCQHVPRCPSATAPDRLAARVVAGHPEQGWSLLCNGVIAFDDGGAITPQCLAMTATAVHARAGRTAPRTIAAAA